MTFESKNSFKALAELPNTFDPKTKRYTWKHHPMMTYALIPQSIMKRIGIVDLYVCLDEDDLDDVDLRALAEEFFNRVVLPEYRSILRMQLAAPVLSAPSGIGCWKLHHDAMAEIA
jgi:hypothetical protein